MLGIVLLIPVICQFSRFLFNFSQQYMRYPRVNPSIFNNYPQLKYKQLQFRWRQLTVISGSLVSFVKVQLCLQLHYQYQEIIFERKYEYILNILQLRRKTRNTHFYMKLRSGPSTESFLAFGDLEYSKFLDSFLIFS